jgi:cobalt/nickel transport system ATP-binding protein
MTPNQPLIEVRGLSYTYPDGHEALHDISLLIHRGEKIGIVGGNGAGKSTLLLHFNGILSGAGGIIIFGMAPDHANIREIRRRVGVVFQNPDDQLFSPTVYDDVAFGPRNLGLSEEEVALRVGESLDAVGLAGFEERSAFHLSFGEKKRAAIATVLAMGPDIIALDEPTSNLDPKGKREMSEFLEKLGGTQIIVTHNLELVRKHCDRAVVMREGRIVADGSPSDIFTDAEFLKSNELA